MKLVKESQWRLTLSLSMSDRERGAAAGGTLLDGVIVIVMADHESMTLSFKVASSLWAFLIMSQKRLKALIHTDTEASKEDIEQLRKYKFLKIGTQENENGDMQGPSGGLMIECGTNNPIEHRLSAEDAECCICLSAYKDGIELKELPCGHHFHCDYVDKWLYINSTCPLCKCDILKRNNSEDEV
ncbi:hypothetical protein Ancab_014821 [Ancistrocladus abbreviatus]